MNETETQLKELYPKIPISDIRNILGQLKDKGIDIDKIDFYSYGAKDINTDILIGNLYQDYGIEIKSANEIPQQTARKSAIFNDNMQYILSDIVTKAKSIVVYGDTGSGKTAYCHRLITIVRKVRTQDIYVYQYPKIDDAKKLGWKILTNLEQLRDLSNCCLWIDEPQHHFKLYDKKNNEILAKLLSMARQKNIILILSTAISQWVNRTLEGQIDLWIVKDCDYTMAKQGSKIRNIIKSYVEYDITGFKLKPNEYLIGTRMKDFDPQHKYTFELPIYWNDGFSKPYRDETNGTN